MIQQGGQFSCQRQGLAFIVTYWQVHIVAQDHSLLHSFAE